MVKSLNLRQVICLGILFAFLGNFLILPPVHAQEFSVNQLPEPGMMLGRSGAFVPILLKGMLVYSDDPLRFDFIVDSGNAHLTPGQIKQESNRLVKYFLTALTIPQNDLWVNLSPYEAERIIPDELGKTELGRDMLAQDYVLKQITASLVYPDKGLGRDFWDKVYKEAYQRFGTTQVPVNTFNKVWIMPDEAMVYENGKAVYVVKSHLKVMLDEDHQSLRSKNYNKVGSSKESILERKAHALGSQVAREIILPEIEKEVNTGKNFASIRQIYQSLILAKWYKETIKDGFLSKVYIGQRRIKGVDLSDLTIKEQIYDRYVKAFKKGVFNLIKEEYDVAAQKTVPKKYFSGGEIFGKIPLKRTGHVLLGDLQATGDQYKLSFHINPEQAGASKAMLGGDRKDGILFVTSVGRNILDMRVDMVRRLQDEGFNAAVVNVQGLRDLQLDQYKTEQKTNGFFNNAFLAESFILNKDTKSALKNAQNKKSPLTEGQQANFAFATSKMLEAVEKSEGFANAKFIVLDEVDVIGLIPALKRKYPDKKVIWACHREVPETALPAAKKLLYDYVKDADAIVGWSKNNLPDYPKGNGSLRKRMTVLPITGLNGSDLKNLEIPQDDPYLAYIREKFGINQTGRPVILQLGRLATIKDFRLSIRAYREMVRAWDKGIKGSKPQLVLAYPEKRGDELSAEQKRFVQYYNEHKGENEDILLVVLELPSERTQIEEQERNETLQLLRKIFSGEALYGYEELFKDPDKRREQRQIINLLEVNALQTIAEVGVNPSAYEAFAVAITEMLWKGKAVFASKTGGIIEQFPERLRRAYLIVIPKWYRAREVILANGENRRNDPALRLAHRMSQYFVKKKTAEVKQLKRFVRRKYSMDKSITEYLKLFKKLEKDSAMAGPTTEKSVTKARSSNKVGGVDMSNVNVMHEGKGVEIRFDPAMMQSVLNNGIEGFVPVLVNIQPITDIGSFLGLGHQESPQQTASL